MSTADILKGKLPEFQRGSKPLEEYLEAAGEFLDGTKEAIENLPNAHDYKDGTPFFIENTLDEKGYSIPSRVKESEKRRVLRDLSELHIKNGTLDGIIHAIRMAGLTPDIRVGWMPSPRALRKGRLVDPVTLQESRYDITRYVYTDMLYGEPRVTDQGVFFYGYRYSDSNEENEIGPLPIFGERYENTPSNPVSVAKTPYIIVRFEEGERTIVTEPSYDPDTGELFEYSTSEEFKLINDILKYFLVENNRPTTLRVIIIVSLQPFEEYIDVEEEYSDTHTYNPDGNDDLVEITTAVEMLTMNSAIQENIVIGSPTHIGDVQPLARFFSTTVSIGNSEGILPIVTNMQAVSGTSYHTSGGSIFFFPLRAGCQFIIQPTKNVDVYGVRGNSPINSELITTIPSGTTQIINPNYEFDQLMFVYEDDLTVDVPVEFTFYEFIQ